VRARRPRFVSPKIDWAEPALAAVLDLAFAETPACDLSEGSKGSRSTPGDDEVERAVDLARRLGIGARVASRAAAFVAGSAIPSIASVQRYAALLQSERRAAVARDLAFEDALRAVTEEAVAGSPAEPAIVLLKHAALRAGGWVASGSRSASDLDLLVAEGSASALFDRLLARGFVVDGEAYEHQLAALRAPSGAVVELHTRVPGMRPAALGARRSVDLEALLETAGGRMRRAAGTDAVWIPPADFLLAHAWFHTFVQHGAAPDLMAPARFLADAQDLGLATDAGADLAEKAAAWLEGGEWSAELAIARRVTRALSAGCPTALRSEIDAAALLDHALACAVDADHVRSVRRHWRRWALPQWSDRPLASAATSYWSREVARSERWVERLLPPFLFVGAFVRLAFWSRRVAIGELPAVLRGVRRARGLGGSASGLRLAARLSPWVERFGAAVPPADFGPCLKRSLLWLDLLARCGIPAQLHCGVRRGDRGVSAAVVEAHAWVTVEGRPFPGPTARPPDFVEVWVD
jgi:hypothetical protein